MRKKTRNRSENKCKRCGIHKSSESFWRDKNTKTGLSGYCKNCRKELWRINKNKYHPTTPEAMEERRKKWLNNKYKRKYGTTYDDIVIMFLKQNRICAICEVVMEMFNVDHDHSTGKIRGLLCFRCNTGLGHFKDRIDLIEKAIGYLKKYQ